MNKRHFIKLITGATVALIAPSTPAAQGIRAGIFRGKFAPVTLWNGAVVSGMNNEWSYLELVDGKIRCAICCIFDGSNVTEPIDFILPGEIPLPPEWDRFQNHLKAEKEVK